MPRLPTVCIIGAGSSGIAAAKTLHERGFAFDCFEASDRVGGNWVYKNRNGMSSAYRSLHINTSRDRMEYPGFPMPRSFPTSPTTRTSPRTSTPTWTTSASATGSRSGRWSSAPSRAPRRAGRSRSTRRDAAYDALLVANGHHWDARWPDPPFQGGETFAGAQLHSHQYRATTPDFFRDKPRRRARDGQLGDGHRGRGQLLARRAPTSPRGAAPGSSPSTCSAARRPVRRARRIPYVVRRRRLQTMLRHRRRRHGALRAAEARPPPRRGAPDVSDDALSRISHGEIEPRPNSRG